MPVASSSFTLEHAQADGSRWCRERHTLTAGEPVEFYYLTPPGFDPQPVMASRVAQVNEQLAEAESRANIDRDGALTTAHLTIAQFGARIRQLYLNSSREDTCRLAWWLLRRIAAGHITDAQCRTAFGMTMTQWTTFKTNKLQPRSDAWAAVLAATGE